MQVPKTGIIYDSRMMQHKARRKHPQTPQRIRVIMDLLEQRSILSHPRVDFIPSIERLALDSELQLAHTSKYIGFCQNLWPKSGHRSDITILDTYFNEQSERIAKMAAGGLLTGLDKLMQGEWQNGFAVIRPPGHHSGAKNTINGFCVYNNVAIGANYLLSSKWNQQRLVILDWDVHHGDGTQHIMQKNPNVLFISIHRHDRGTFYPSGDQGSFQNNGQQPAKGYKINIPLDYVDEKFVEYSDVQSPGDNEYLYIYHRIIQPIIKSFDPEVILVSSGFDAAVGDPLGGFTVTPTGYHYMMKRLLGLERPLLVALQGGYNLTAIKKSAHGVIRALLKQPYLQPLKDSKGASIKQQHLQHILNVADVFHEQLDKIIQFHSQYWPVLKSQPLQKYTDRIKSNKQRVFSIIDDDQIESCQDDVQDEDGRDRLDSKDVTSGEQLFHNDTRVQVVKKGELKQKQREMRQKKEKEKIQQQKNGKNKKQNNEVKFEQQKTAKIANNDPMNNKAINPIELAAQGSGLNINNQVSININSNISPSPAMQQSGPSLIANSTPTQDPSSYTSTSLSSSLSSSFNPSQNFLTSASSPQSQLEQKPRRKMSRRQIRQRQQEQELKKALIHSQKEDQNQSITAQFFFAAGHMQRFKKFSLNNPKIQKWAYQSQIRFFESQFEQKRFAPTYYGRQDSYVIIQNILHQQRSPTIMDIKLSRQSKNPFLPAQKQQKEKKKQLKSTADKLSFRISGYTTADFKQGGIITYNQDQVKNILKIVVDHTNKQLFSGFLLEMSNCMKNVKRKYWGTSIMLVKGEQMSNIKWIDFHYYGNFVFIVYS